MKILTWNLERAPKRKVEAIQRKLQDVDADILILTETALSVNPGHGYSQISTEPLPADFDGIKYQTGENRTTICTRYDIANMLTTLTNTQVLLLISRLL